SRSQYVAQAGLELEQFSCLSLLSAGITGVHHHPWLQGSELLNKLLKVALSLMTVLAGDPPASASHSVGITGVYHHAQ
ncbi:hypothetical protein GW7_00093, partial [Heterocephalus glaber]